MIDGRIRFRMDGSVARTLIRVLSARVKSIS